MVTHTVAGSLMIPQVIPTFTARSYAFAPYIDARNWIGGRWTDPQAGRWLPIDNPRHGKAMGQVALSESADVDAAVAAAKAAFPGWRATPLKDRAQVMFRLKNLLEMHMEELCWLLSHENGKTLAEAKGDIEKGIECIEFGCALPNLAQGEQLDVSRGVHCEVTHEPLGVCAGIVPFNFPIMVPLWMIPIVLTAGNCFILKPSEQVPYGAVRLAQLMKEAGLPDGVFQLVQGGREVVEALADHPGVEAIGFVGSTRVAKLLYARGAAAGKRMLCLGGAKNHLIVVPDADVDMTASNIVASSYGCAGQRCMASSVVVAVGPVQRIVDRVAELARNIRLGEDMGAIINRGSVARIEGYIAEAEQHGATVLVDGRDAEVPGNPGFWVGPTVLDHVNPDMPAGCEEIFGPVLSIIRAETLDEAIAIQNNSLYGNGASIYTSSGAVAQYVAQRLEAGMCGVNVGVPVPREPFAFGGWKASKFGHGDITGMDGFHFWTRPRKVTTKWAPAEGGSWMS